MSYTIATEGLTVDFGDTLALDRVTVSFAPNCISGVLGRNGAGKSTLLGVIAGWRSPTAGRVTVNGVDPFEQPELMANTCLARRMMPSADSTSVADHFGMASMLRPTWDHDYAEHLLSRFDVPRKHKISKLSDGKQAAVAVITGLASRAPLTIFDEPHLGMDAAARYAFYEELVADYANCPRTVLLSTHLIDEIANVVEDVLILDHGRVLAHDTVDDLCARGAQLTGRAADVDDVVFGRRVVSRRSLGPISQAVVFGELDARLVERARESGVDVAPLPLQDLFVSLTGAPGDSSAVYQPEAAR